MKANSSPTKTRFGRSLLGKRIKKKMNKIILIAFLVMLLPTVTALYGGDTWTYHFPLCNQLKVNITGTLPIDDNEYLILNNCTETSPNNYICNCSDDYYFNVSFKTNTINDYTFLFNYEYSKEVKPVSSGGSQRTSSYASSWVCGNWSECLNNKTERICRKGKTINYTQFKSCLSKETFIKDDSEIIEREVEEEIILTSKIETPKENLTQEPKDDRPTEEQEKWIYIGIILITVIFIIFCFYVIKKKSYSKRSKKEESL